MIDYGKFWDDQLADTDNPLMLVRNVRVVNDEVLYDSEPLGKAATGAEQ